MSAAAPTEIEILTHAIESLDSPESAHVIKIIGTLRLPESALNRVDDLLEKSFKSIARSESHSAAN